MRSWVASANGHGEFPIQNLPLGVFSAGGREPRTGAAIGDLILDLAAIGNLIPQELAAAVGGGDLNAMLALAPGARAQLRTTLSGLLSREAHRAAVEPHLIAAAECRLHLPAAIGDYTDFYAGIHHAMNVGRQFRPDNPLLPNYKYMPIGYHGRSSSVQASGAAVRRPRGQTKSADGPPGFGPTRRLDYEVELGVWVGSGNALGEPIGIADAAAHVAGLCLLNDWSARDIQAWEYQPLGPFLSKSFSTSVSPWIVTCEALEPFRVAQPARPAGDPQPLDYLLDAQDQSRGAYSITLEAWIRSAAMRERGMAAHRLSRAAATSMYWTVAQMVAHHTSNGCNLRPGDLLGTGTISEPCAAGYGSLLEITQGGRLPITLPSGEARAFLEDGDELTLRGQASASGFASIGFGSCSGIIAA
ncbi:MAG TPA: fumarylacetoacetase [Steroidobacteraceae bacterium]|nr:fumarylacetoacetase [Steroidobacteraceae bacterium]